MAAETSFEFTQLPPLRVPSFPFAHTETSFDNGTNPIELGAGSLAGAFSSQYAKEDGTIYLQGGTVAAGTGVATIADIAISDTDGLMLKAAGQHMYLVCTGDGVTADGVLLPGFNLSTATVAYAAVVPDNTLPTAGSATGKLCHIDLGVFTDNEFLPSAAGNLQIAFCPGAYTVSRV